MLNITALMEHVARHLHTAVRRYSGSHKLLAPVPSEIPKVSSGTDRVSYMTMYDPRWLSSLYSCRLLEFVSETMLLYNLFHEESLTVRDILVPNILSQTDYLAINQTFHKIVFDNQENTTHHNPYDQEVREFASIRNGDLEMLKKTMEEDYTGTIGTLASTPLRDCQNLAIVLITLASRAAMEGGVLPEIAYTLSDTYIQKVEELHVPAATVQLAKQAEFHYAALVRDTKAPAPPMHKSTPRTSASTNAKAIFFPICTAKYPRLILHRPCT